MRKCLLILSLLSVFLLPARAQFYLAGDDPAHLRWYSLETAHYEVIYPQGADSLARTYARALEQFRVPMGQSLGGMIPGEGQRRKMPVVLHTHNPYSNGSVGWAPSRMDLYTHPEFYGADPTSWPTMLASHEPRHQAQLQFGQRGILPWLSGQMWAPVYWQVYLDMAVGEGDAVTAETGLAAGTRARTYEFLDFYRAALADGDQRSWDRWRYGSFKHYTPDHYALGYITVAGARTLYDAPLLVREALDLSWKKPWYIAPYNTQKVISQHAGKPFNEAFKDILDHFESIWEADAEARGPFMPTEEVTPDEPYAMTYSSPQVADERLFALRESYRETRHLVTFDKEGKPKRLIPFGSHTSSLAYEPNRHRLYWSETLPHPRWDLDGSSILRYYDVKTGRRHDVTREGTRFYNPQCSPDGDRLAAIEHIVSGQTALVIVNVDNGKVLERHLLPDGIQGTELIWAEEALYTFGLSEEGYGLYQLLADGNWKTILPPSHQKIGNPGAGDDCLEWESDRTGVNELYRFFPETGRLLQMTSSRFGGVDYAWKGDCLYYNVPVKEGFQIFRTNAEDLQPREVDYADVHSYTVEDEITAQEKALGAVPDRKADVPMAEPRRYHKLTHPLRVHSWLPFYVDYDAVKEASMDFSYETASLGLSLFFQNTLGTLSGSAGIGVHPDPDISSKWRSALHLKMTYTGLYPVIEGQLDFGDRNDHLYMPIERISPQATTYALQGVRQNRPNLSGFVKTYIPFRFSKGGILSGITPQLQYSFSTDPFVTEPLAFSTGENLGSSAFYRLSSPDISLEGPFTTHLSASLRGYIMTSRADSQTYPRWGLGLEAGLALRPGMMQYYSPNAYFYAYGYLPGLTRLQGLKWTTTFQVKVGPCHIGSIYANVLPRGFEGVASTLVSRNFNSQWRVTGDYAIPIYVGDISIPGVAYIKNFLLTPHADFTVLPPDQNLWSVGADLSASLARLFVLPFDASIGVSCSYLGGTLFDQAKQDSRWSLSLIFGVDF